MALGRLEDPFIRLASGFHGIAQGIGMPRWYALVLAAVDDQHRMLYIGGAQCGRALTQPLGIGAQYGCQVIAAGGSVIDRSEEHTSELQSLMRISYAVFCLKKKNKIQQTQKDMTSTQITHSDRDNA